MLSFESDYNIGAHPKIMQKLNETNFEMLSGYGSDKYCQSAIKRIKKACKVLEVASDNGKIVAKELNNYLETFYYTCKTTWSITG